MKSFLRITFSSIICVLLIISCRKNDELVKLVDSPITIPEKLVKASITGAVFDQNNEPVENALVRIDNKSISTDENGVFQFQDIDMNAYGTLLQIDKEGFFSSSKLVQATADKNSYTKIRMIPKVLTGSFTAADGGNINTSGGARVNIPAAGVQLVDGSSYTGTVNIYAKWLDPSSTASLLEMPGDLRAINAANEFVQLATYGIIGVELEGENGQPLQIADGETASIELPIPLGLLSNAPNTIPLWHFDETNGHWIEEGSATLQGDKYVGETKHFSFWICSTPFPRIDLSGYVLGQNGEAIVGARVEIKLASNGSTRFGYTNSDGKFSGKVPKDELLIIKVKDACGEIANSVEHGPFPENTSLAVLTELPSTDLVKLKGMLTNCSNQAVSKGYLKITFSNGNIDFVAIDDNGNFEETIILCDDVSNMNFIGVDAVEQLQSEVQHVEIDAGQNVFNVNQIQACDQLANEFFYYQVYDSITVYPIGFSAKVWGSAIRLEALTEFLPNNPSVIVINEAVLGNNIPISTELVSPIPNNNSHVNVFNCSPCPELVVNITKLGGAGEYIIGTIVGTTSINGTTNIPINGSFKIIGSF